MFCRVFCGKGAAAAFRCKKKKSVFFQAEAERLSWSGSFKTSKAIYGGFLKELLSSWVKSRLKVTALKGLELWAQVILVFDKSYISQKVFEILTQRFKVPFLNTNDGTLQGERVSINKQALPYMVWSGKTGELLWRRYTPLTSGLQTLEVSLWTHHGSGPAYIKLRPIFDQTYYFQLGKIFHPLQGHWFVMSYFHVETEGY